MFSRVRLLLTISIGLLVLAACGEPVPPPTGFEVAVTVVGDGNVTSDPAGIDTAAGTTAATFSENAEVVLTAVPTGNATFTNWTGGACDASTELTCTIPDLTADTAVTANFTDDVEPGVDVTYTVNVVNGGTAAGTVSSSSGLVTDCADSCEDTAAENTTVTLTATATAGGFAGWTGGLCDGQKSLTCDVTVAEGMDPITANFNDVLTETVDLGEAVEELINASSVDAIQYPAGHNYQGSSDLDLGYDATHSTRQWIGLRFDFATMPAGSNISSAVISMTVEANSSDPVNVTLSGEAQPAPATFADDADTTGSLDTSTRAGDNGTTATFVWEIPGSDAWTADGTVNTPDITAIVQEVVSLDGWGGSLVVFVSPDADPLSTGTRRVTNPLDDATGPLQITVEYVALPAVI